MRFPHVAAALRVLVGSVAALSGIAVLSCSDDSKAPECVNCEAWTQLVDDLGRYPAAHPGDPDFIVYSTIRKGTVQSDSLAEADEDIWLLWRGSSDRSQWVRWQLTGEELGENGDNFQASWSPSGTQIAFVHTDGGGTYEVWRLGVNLPPGEPPSASFDPRGALERVVAAGRDPAWESEDRILFSRDDKLYRIELGGARDGINEIQLTFDPPTFSGGDEIIDRQPSAAADGAIVFTTEGRVPLGNLRIAAFEISGTPPETTATSALLSLQIPGDPTATYPLMDEADTLRTPANDADPYLLLQSVPSNAAPYFVGVRRDSRVFPPSEETYCDSTITRPVVVTTGETTSIELYFELARGTLLITSGGIATSMQWSRADGLDGGGANIGLPCEIEAYDCVLSHQVDLAGNPIPGTLEPHRVIGQVSVSEDSIAVDSLIVFVPPGETTFVKLFCPDDSCGCVPPRPSGSSRGTAITHRGGSSGTPFDLRADDPYGIWRIDLTDPSAPGFTPVVTSESPLQSPALSDPFPGGVRYLAYASNESGRWVLNVQKLDANLAPLGDRIRVETPGTTDNYICSRSIFHPTLVPGTTPGLLRLLVTMTDCPDNAFEGSEIDDFPWSQGELNVWEVEVPVE
jgi:hypothetical protein